MGKVNGETYLVMTRTTSVVAKAGLYFLKDLHWQLYGRSKRMSVGTMKQKMYMEKSHCLLKSYVENSCNNFCL